MSLEDEVDKLIDEVVDIIIQYFTSIDKLSKKTPKELVEELNNIARDDPQRFVIKITKKMYEKSEGLDITRSLPAMEMMVNYILLGLNVLSGEK